MAAQAVYAWPQQRPKGSTERPGETTDVSHVPPGRDDVHALASAPDLIARPLAEPVIAVDAMGGDYAPDEIVAGALAAQREHGLTTLLTGPPARLRPVIARLGGRLRAAGGARRGRRPDGRGRPGRLPAAPVKPRHRLPAGPARPGLGGRLGRVDRRDRGERPAPAAPAAGRAAARPGGRAADPSHPDGAHRRGRHRRPQAGDARPVRPARRGVRADRAGHRRPPGSGCSPSGPSPARGTR